MPESPPPPPPAAPEPEDEGPAVLESRPVSHRPASGRPSSQRPVSGRPGSVRPGRAASRAAAAPALDEQDEGDRAAGPLGLQSGSTACLSVYICTYIQLQRTADRVQGDSELSAWAFVCRLRHAFVSWGALHIQLLCNIHTGLQWSFTLCRSSSAACRLVSPPQTSAG